ncbi:MAG TPA: patatin-like phospholipase family protein [Solirubrobacteraceae bacterium]|nr:patatin-like phospholipase family protein [Solirubrobacteraceae bacterium]
MQLNNLKPEPRNQGAPRTFRILALDGGGYKGIFSAAILDRLAADLELDLASEFDLIAGTSRPGRSSRWGWEQA